MKIYVFEFYNKNAITATFLFNALSLGIEFQKRVVGTIRGHALLTAKVFTGPDVAFFAGVPSACFPFCFSYASTCFALEEKQ